ncbi:hypothetical protein [Sphingobacterium sp. SGL-16]|uniref:hypothetical protein n=1 Tax=Sphingobacterium sp. SGL-16 TaxID=2710883 RepID=UPI0013EC1043|nr:hypothetical protein [Sphingobacterium sp. SGL-16]NGM71674.1 hypothetical protein [Sphingobacterium sp. SGL-16]
MPSYRVGDVVSTKTHPYFKDIVNVNIAGDPVNVIPLMVITEIYRETRTVYNEETGEEITRKGTGKCKCMWFSLKTNSFSEAWFDFEKLKSIEDRDGIVFKKNGSDFEFKKYILKRYLNKPVLFKTSFLELRKIKETRIHNHTGNKISDYTSLLNFVAPPLHIIDVKITDDKVSGKFDSKTGTFKKYLPQLSFKCRFYNASADKWSELFIPSDALVELEDVGSYVETIESDRKKRKFYIYDYTQEVDYDSSRKEPITILEIDSITYLNGLYSLKTFDIIHQEWKILDIPFEMKDVISKENLYGKNTYPDFAFRKGSKAPDADKLLTEFVDFVSLNEKRKKTKYLLINYINKSDKIEQRVVRDFFIVPGVTKKASTYIHGFCCKKREERSFNFNNIRSVKVIALA